MTDQMNDSVLLARLRRIDPLDPSELPSAVETEAALGRLLRRGPGSRRPEGRSQRRLGRPRILIGGTAAAAMLAVALALLLGTSATTPAFAVTDHHNGTVTVKLLKLSGITGANRRLAALGIRAKIVREVQLARVVSRLNPCLGGPAESGRTLSFDPRKIPPKRLLLLSADRTAQLISVSGQVKVIKLAHLPALKRAQALAREVRRLARSGNATVQLMPTEAAIHATGKTRTGRAVKTNGVVRIVCGRVAIRKNG